MVWVAFAIVLLEDALHFGLIRNLGDYAPDAFTVPFVTGYMLLMAGLLGTSLVGHPKIVRARSALRAGAAGGLLVLGIVAAFSIGLPLIVAGVLAAAATVRTLSPPHLTPAALSGGVAALVSVAVLVSGFEVTERLIVCPDHGTMSGGGSGFVTGPYHYECVDGRLSFHSGSCTGGASSIDSNGNVAGGC
jgi:hypothetical protein